MNARDVFFEDLEALTADALKGIIRTFQNDRSLALVVSRISFCFWEFRCTASMPRRPRRLRPTVESPVEGGPSSLIPDWKTIHRRDAMRYQPSNTSQGSHWTRWQADVGQILAMCTSLSEVSIISTNHQPSNVYLRRDYRAWFPPPDLTNEGVLNGLLHSTNLQSLYLVDPTPLEQYGPSLASWGRLKHLTINITRTFEDLQTTAFIPPKSLVSFRFHDRSPGIIPWPLASDLARCDNLQVLDLGVACLRGPEAESTCNAIGYLCKAYQHSLRELTLVLVSSHGPVTTLQDILVSVSPLHFKKLQRLRLPVSPYDTSLFSCFNADQLTYVEVGWLMLEPTTGSREEKWSRALSHSSLRMLQELVINQDDPDGLRKEALSAVCERLGITLSFGWNGDSEYHEVEDENADFEDDM